jgi:hypothetical protein
MTLNLILAACWLALAIGSILYQLAHPEVRAFFSNGISPTWISGIALLMFGYNMLRWWLVRVQRRDRQAMDRSAGRMQHRVEERNPDFDFSDEPKK